MTKRENLTAVREVLVNANANAELVAFVDKELARLDSKPVANPENEALKAQFMTYLADHPNATVAEVRKAFDLSSQKVTALMASLVKENKVAKTVEKKTSHFNLL